MKKYVSSVRALLSLCVLLSLPACWCKKEEPKPVEAVEVVEVVETTVDVNSLEAAPETTEAIAPQAETVEVAAADVAQEAVKA